MSNARKFFGCSFELETSLAAKLPRLKIFKLHRVRTTTKVFWFWKTALMNYYVLIVFCDFLWKLIKSECKLKTNSSGFVLWSDWIALKYLVVALTGLLFKRVTSSLISRFQCAASLCNSESSSIWLFCFMQSRHHEKFRWFQTSTEFNNLHHLIAAIFQRGKAFLHLIALSRSEFHNVASEFKLENASLAFNRQKY